MSLRRVVQAQVPQQLGVAVGVCVELGLGTRVRSSVLGETPPASDITAARPSHLQARAGSARLRRAQVTPRARSAQRSARRGRGPRRDRAPGGPGLRVGQRPEPLPSLSRPGLTDLRPHAGPCLHKRFDTRGGVLSGFIGPTKAKMKTSGGRRDEWRSTCL